MLSHTVVRTVRTSISNLSIKVCLFCFVFVENLLQKGFDMPVNSKNRANALSMRFRDVVGCNGQICFLNCEFR